MAEEDIAPTPVPLYDGCAIGLWSRPAPDASRWTAERDYIVSRQVWREAYRFWNSGGGRNPFAKKLRGGGVAPLSPVVRSRIVAPPRANNVSHESVDNNETQFADRLGRTISVCVYTLEDLK